MWIIIGCIVAAVAWVIAVVFSIMAAIAASRNEWYRYPIAIPILKWPSHHRNRSVLTTAPAWQETCGYNVRHAMSLLQARQLVKSYAGRRVVDQVSFEIDPGEIVGLLGRNGAGKTTSFRMVIGMITPEAGQVVFKGQDVTTLPMYKHALAGMGYLSQEPSVFQRMTVEENLLAILETQPLTRAARKRRAQELIEQFGLLHKTREQARTCSGGERRRLEIARALITKPRLMLLDEPFAAVDPHTVEELQAEVKRLADDGIAMLITDHNVQQTLRICDRAYIIHEGRNLREGTPRQIINDPLVRDAYLASTFRGDEFDDRPISRVGAEM